MFVSGRSVDGFASVPAAGLSGATEGVDAEEDETPEGRTGFPRPAVGFGLPGPRGPLLGLLSLLLLLLEDVAAGGAGPSSEEKFAGP